MKAAVTRLAPALLVCCLAAAGCRTVGDWLAGEPQSLAQYHAAEELFDDDRYLEAAVAYRAWLLDYRDAEDLLRPKVMYKLAECYRLTGDHPRAIRTYRTIREKFARSPHPEVRDLVEKVVEPRLKDLERPPAKKPPDPRAEKPG